MLTFFTTAKPFRGQDGLIQQNALKSWKRLRPDVEVILFGDDAGAAAYDARGDKQDEIAGVLLQVFLTILKDADIVSRFAM